MQVRLLLSSLRNLLKEQGKNPLFEKVDVQVLQDLAPLRVLLQAAPVAGHHRASPSAISR